MSENQKSKNTLTPITKADVEDFKCALKTIGDISYRAAEEIKYYLTEHPDFKEKFESCKISRGEYKPKSEPKNYYLNYISILMKERKGDKTRAISLEYSDVDKNTVNTHTQFGRIQFCKDVVKKENAPYDPNEKIPWREARKFLPIKTGDIALIFCNSKMEDSGQSLYDDSYDPEKLVNEFMNWK